MPSSKHLPLKFPISLDLARLAEDPGDIYNACYTHTKVYHRKLCIDNAGMRTIDHNPHSL